MAPTHSSLQSNMRTLAMAAASKSPSQHKAILKGLSCTGQKKMPFTYLYDDRGSELYEKITKLEEYYPFLAEEALLRQHADDIIGHIPEGAVLVELGCGTARKTAILLKALASRDGWCHFAGIDVSASFLEEARSNLGREVPEASVELVRAEYMEGLRQVRAAHPDRLLCILWLGSSVGNLSPSAAVAFLREVVDAAGSNIQFFLCADMWKDEDVLYAAYHDSQGVTEAFIKNGMRNGLAALGHCATSEEVQSWVYETVVNREHRQVEMYVRFPNGLEIAQHAIDIRKGEAVLVEVSRKFTAGDIHEMAGDSRMYVQAAWRNCTYGAQMLLPASEALRLCWVDTDRLFVSIPDWAAQPIDVRHPFCFYYGHLVAFAKLKMLPGEAPSANDVTFSRGIDPIVMNPTCCHSHPEVPAQWPTRAQIESYVSATRSLVQAAVTSGKASMRQVCIALEHERMHQETLCYMLAQERKQAFIRAPPPQPPTPSLPASKIKRDAPEVLIAGGEVTLGVELSPAFVWDNEGPREKSVRAVAPFRVSADAVTVAEFRRFIEEERGYDRPELWDPVDIAFFRQKGQRCPATWSHRGAGEYYVHAPSGTHLWSEVADQPVYVSLSEATAFCNAYGARIMTEVEYQRIVDTDAPVHAIRTEGWEWTSTVFSPLEGFEAMPEYKEYSTDFFDGQHYVLKGSSPVTHPALYRDSFRNYFQRQYPFVFAKFRCCART